MKAGKVILTILVIILISLISFGGIYVKNTKFVENIVPEFIFGMDLAGGRSVLLKLDDSSNEVYYDKDGNEVTEKKDDTKTEKVPVNPEENKTKENYEKAKQILENRLNQMEFQNYTIRQNEQTGEIFVNLTENSDTDLIIQYMTVKGDFTVVDDETKEVLLNNSHLKNAQVGYGATETGTSVYLDIILNEEGTSKFKDITNKYIKTKGEDDKEVEKTVSLKMDNTVILSTYFSEEITNGVIRLSIGSSAKSQSELQGYLREALNMSVLLNTGSMPLTYSLEQNKLILSQYSQDMFKTPAIVLGAIFALAFIVAIIKYGKNGLLSLISFIGYSATLLLFLRLTNVVITLEGIAGIIASLALQYIITMTILNKMKKQELKFKNAMLKSLLIAVPTLIIAVCLSFAGWLPAVSFGMTLFWGIAVSVIYNFFVTGNLIEKQ